jgi:hypothetical protein
VRPGICADCKRRIFFAYLVDLQASPHILFGLYDTADWPPNFTVLTLSAAAGAIAEACRSPLLVRM